MKVLNLYAGIGGNRKLWGDEHEITSVENVPYIAEAYRKLYPQDTLIEADAHQYLLDHHKEFDFIWSSPPCPTHSVTNHFLYAQGNHRYPDMGLYQEIIFLRQFYEGKYCVENVISYYDPLITPSTTFDRHYYWSNFYIPRMVTGRKFNVTNARASSRQSPGEYKANLEDYHGIHLPEGTKNARKLLRNAVQPQMGLHIFTAAQFKTEQEVLL